MSSYSTKALAPLSPKPMVRKVQMPSKASYSKVASYKEDSYSNNDDDDEGSNYSEEEEQEYVSKKAKSKSYFKAPPRKEKKPMAQQSYQIVESKNSSVLQTIKNKNVLSNGKVHLNVSEFLHILKHFYDHSGTTKFVSTQSTHNSLINSIAIAGEAEKKVAKLTLSFSIDIMNYDDSGEDIEEELFNGARWIRVPLLCNASESIVLHECTLKSRSQDATESNAVAYYVGMHGQDIIMLCSKPGKYMIDLQISVAISKQSDDSNRHIVLSLPKALQNDLMLRIQAKEDIQAKVTPSLFSSVQKVDQKLGDLLLFDLKTSFPSSSSIDIQWSKQSPQQLTEMLQELKDADENEEEKIPLTVTSDQNSVHAIGEGMILSTVFIDYEINHGTINTVSLEIDDFGKSFKVLNVFGNGVKQWNLKDVANTADSDTAEVKKRKLLHVEFNYGMEKAYRLEVHTELNMGSTSAVVHVPSFFSTGVTREKGTSAVLARTFVEIKESRRQYLARIDPSELPNHSRYHLSFPILHAYKILERDYSLELSVTRHDDIEVLCSCISSAVYEVTKADTSFQHKISLQLKNTAKQYLRIRLPDVKAEIWSTMVNGKSVKPAMETKENAKYILLPLNDKYRTSTKGIDISLLFQIPAEKLASSGVINFELARFDSPIQSLTVTVYAPEPYDYAEFEGNLKETGSTYVAPPSQWATFGKLMGGGFGLMRKRATRYQEKSADSYYAGQNSVSFQGSSRTNVSFTFQRYLVMENFAMNLAVPFKEKTKSFLEKRSLYLPDFGLWIQRAGKLFRLCLYLSMYFLFFYVIYRIVRWIFFR